MLLFIISDNHLAGELCPVCLHLVLVEVPELGQGLLDPVVVLLLKLLTDN